MGMGNDTGVTGKIEVGVVSRMGVAMVPSGRTLALPPPFFIGRTGSKVRKWLRSWERRDLRGSYWGVLMCSILIKKRDRSLHDVCTAQNVRVKLPVLR